MCTVSRRVRLSTLEQRNDSNRPQGGGGGRRHRSRRRHHFGGQPQQFREPFQQIELPPMLTADELDGKTKTELAEVAKEFDIEILTPAKVKKDELIAQIIAAQAARSGIEAASGILDVLPEGYGFLRRAGYVIGNDDIYVSQAQIRRFELRRGDFVDGLTRRPKESEKYYGLIRSTRSTVSIPSRPVAAASSKKARPSIRTSTTTWKCVRRNSRPASSIFSARSARASAR